MDNQAFDALTRRAARVASRRAFGTAGIAGLASAVFALAGMAPGDDAEARNKKKKKGNNKKKKRRSATGPCQFDKTATTWTLRGSCTATETIELPAGVTLNGARRTIFLEGAWSAFQYGVYSSGRVATAGILAKSGRAGIRDLTLDGSRLNDSCTPETTAAAGIVFLDTSGTIQRVTVRNFDAGTCSNAIATTAAGAVDVEVLDSIIDSCSRTAISLDSNSMGSTFAVRRTAVRGVGRRGISALGGTSSIIDNQVERVGEAGIHVNDGGLPGASAIISDNTVTDANTGIVVATPGMTATVSGNRVSGQTEYAMWVQSSATATVRSNQFDSAWLGVYVLTNAIAFVQDNTIKGGEGSGHGVRCNTGGGGRIEENVIYNFFEPDPNFSSCGIWLEDTSGPVTLSGNIFRNPPGNERNICDYRTASSAARRGGLTPVERRRDDAPIDDSPDYLGREDRRS